jgi:divalent metal cation (Fe/Co/Zn/Cd) transporter
VSLEAIATLWHHAAPERSIAGIVLAIASLIAMPFLARAKRRVAGRLGSAAMTGDAKQTEFCAYLSAILLAGLLLNAAFGLWWADPAAALIMSPSSRKRESTLYAERPAASIAHSFRNLLLGTPKLFLQRTLG